MNDLSESELGWLAGMIDGEGNISVGLRDNPNGAKYLDVKVRISGTDIRMMHHVGALYERMNLVFFTSLMNKNRSDWKTGLNVEVARQGSTLKLLATIRPYLRGKHLVADTAMEVIKYVKSLPRAGNGTRINYAEHDEFKQLFGEFNRERLWYYDPSTTTRKAREAVSLDGIV